jgi:hypothetical protein
VPLVGDGVSAESAPGDDSSVRLRHAINGLLNVSLNRRVGVSATRTIGARGPTPRPRPMAGKGGESCSPSTHARQKPDASKDQQGIEGKFVKVPDPVLQESPVGGALMLLAPSRCPASSRDASGLR